LRRLVEEGARRATAKRKGRQAAALQTFSDPPDQAAVKAVRVVFAFR
jgi:hypothetical protein